ncbi:MAG TPA: IS1 family transposase [Pyrinomonadaceae bacterium]|nr:IS1 family transposase [Pyrinomonadaceae bacterium]
MPLNKALLCLYLLVEGNSIRSIERVVGLEKKTIIALMLLAGKKCERLLDRRIRGVKVKDVQADEIWGFVWCKQKTKNAKGYGDGCGDAYTFVAIERHTKLVLAWHLGQRTTEDTEVFIEKLERATAGRFQLTTDGWESYPEAILLSLGVRVDYARLVKTYHAAHPTQSPEGERRYSPSRVLEIFKDPRIGNPADGAICTSHIERQNLTMRMMMRRLTRLTNAFSKKRENLRAALALHFAFYNFCRIHKTIRCTPAMAAGVTKTMWEMKDLLARAPAVD